MESLTRCWLFSVLVKQFNRVSPGYVMGQLKAETLAAAA
jgi:hypothetical protein